jgi:hypothetical protein
LLGQTAGFAAERAAVDAVFVEQRGVADHDGLTFDNGRNATAGNDDEVLGAAHFLQAGLAPVGQRPRQEVFRAGFSGSD